MNTIRQFFLQNQDNFFQFSKIGMRDLPLPPVSCAPVENTTNISRKAKFVYCDAALGVLGTSYAS